MHACAVVYVRVFCYGWAGVDKYHLLRCVGANCRQQLHANRDSIG